MDCGVCQNGDSETHSRGVQKVDLCKPLTSYYQKCFITVSLTSHLHTLNPRVVVVSMNTADVS